VVYEYGPSGGATDHGPNDLPRGDSGQVIDGDDGRESGAAGSTYKIDLGSAP
jgi:hypothetical protein